jgi:hypothetical protein
LVSTPAATSAFFMSPIDIRSPLSPALVNTETLRACACDATIPPTRAPPALVMAGRTQPPVVREVQAAAAARSRILRPPRRPSATWCEAAEDVRLTSERESRAPGAAAVMNAPAPHRSGVAAMVRVGDARHSARRGTACGGECADAWEGCSATRCDHVPKKC